tara:strand:- start:11 stop:730 length:720 start_codon:yes stop_codon:yes gene_type:complete
MTEAERRRQARRGASGQNLRILGEPTKDLKANDTRRIRGNTQYYNPETKKFQNRRYVAKAPGTLTESQKREQENEKKQAAANKAREEGQLSNIPPNREQLAIDQDDTFAGFDAMRNPERIDANTFAPAPMTTKEMLSEIDNIMAEPESLDDVLKKSLTGTTEVVNEARKSTMADQLRETTGRLEQLKILQEGGVKTGPQGMIKTDKGFASVKTAAGNKALKKQLARLKAQQLAKIRIGG